MMRLSLVLSPLTAVILLPAPIVAQNTFDNSGTSLLKGTYFIRHVLFSNLTDIGQIGEATALTGTVNFDGTGSYSLKGQVSDTTVNSGAPSSFSFSGTYAVNASGLFVMQNPLSSSDTIFGGVGKSAITGSSTESDFFDLMVAVPMGSGVSNASLNGSYRLVGMDYPNGDVTKVLNSTFLIAPNGSGSLGAVSISGHAAGVSDSTITQSISGATYSLSTSSGTMTFPNSNTTPLINGTKQFFVSADGNVIAGGSLDGYDIEVGIKVSGSSAGSSFNGMYYAGGEDYDSSTFASQGYYYLDAFYGSISAKASGGNTTVYAHQRLNSDATSVYDSTYDDEFTLNAGGTATETYFEYFAGAAGTARVVVGLSTNYAIELDVPAQSVSAGGSVFLNPFGVVNTANYLPITNPVAPGEYLSLFGTGLAGTTASASLPFPTNGLKGVSVTIDSIPAPVYYISPTQVICIAPFELSAPYAVVEVTNNGVHSNQVTLFTDFSAPGLFTVNESGTGAVAAEHADFSLVTSSNPAVPGETISLYGTGLGAVTPPVSDGTAAPTSTLSMTDDTMDIFVDGVETPLVRFAGLAPGYAGLYQVNFVVPSVTVSGLLSVAVNDLQNGAYNSMGELYVSAAASASAAVRPLERRLPNRMKRSRQALAHKRGMK